jgi:hypothetical protein
LYGSEIRLSPPFVTLSISGISPFTGSIKALENVSIKAQNNSVSAYK